MTRDGRGWWRRNAIALGAIVVGAVATFVVGFEVPYLQSDAVRPVPRLVAAGDTARVGDARVELTKAGEFRVVKDSTIDVPRGTMLLAVLIRIRTDAPLSRYCSVKLVRRDTTDRISWDPVLSPSDYGYGVSTSTEHSCDLSEKSGSRLLEQTFLVPESVYDRVAIRFTSTPADVHRGSPAEVVDLGLPAKPYSNVAAG